MCCSFATNSLNVWRNKDKFVVKALFSQAHLYCCTLLLLYMYICSIAMLFYCFCSVIVVSLFVAPSAGHLWATLCEKKRKLFLLFLCLALLLLISCKQCLLRQFSQIVSSQLTSLRRQTDCLVDRLDVKWCADGQLVSQASCEQVF